MIDVELLGPEALHWNDHDDKLIQYPVYRAGAGTYGRTISVDPAPCYHHDMDLVRELAARCWERFPLTDTAVKLVVLSHEFTGRNNGCASEDWLYEQPDGSKWPTVTVKDYLGKTREFVAKQALNIALCGKRIPPMASMTRYLVTHEYGHLAWYRAAHLMGFNHAERELEKRYMAVRGLTWEPAKRPLRWHERASEIIANDFRIVVMGEANDFWPHDVSHPLKLDVVQLGALTKWWKDACELCATGDFVPGLRVASPVATEAG